jgi:hypothetical protein
LLKYDYSLSLKALYPSSLERQNVALALQIFNSSNVSALNEFGPLEHLQHFEDIADFIKLITTWWSIINIKTPLKGQRLKDVFSEPITQI